MQEIPMVDPKKVELEAGLLSLLAQETRLRILYLLRDGEKCACEISPAMPEDPSVISRHLVKLREAGILDYRKEGVSIYYWIKEPRVFKILEMVDGILKTAVQQRHRLMHGIL
jgi:ArsR family transcriptional regulator